MFFSFIVYMIHSLTFRFYLSNLEKDLKGHTASMLYFADLIVSGLLGRPEALRFIFLNESRVWNLIPESRCLPANISFTYEPELDQTFVVYTNVCPVVGLRDAHRGNWHVVVNRFAAVRNIGTQREHMLSLLCRKGRV